MPRRTAKTMRRRVKSASKKMAQSVRMRRGAPAKKNVPKKKTQKAKKAKKSKSGNLWNQQVMAAFAELRAKNPKATLAEAMSLAAARRDARYSAPGGKEKSSVTIPRRPLSALPILEQNKKKLSPKAKKKALSTPVGKQPSTERVVTGKYKTFKSEGPTSRPIGPFPLPNPNWQKAKEQKEKKTKKKGKKSSKKWAKKYKPGSQQWNNPLASNYNSDADTV